MQKRRKNRLLLFKNGEVKMRKVIKIFIIFTIGFNCIAAIQNIMITLFLLLIHHLQPIKVK